MSYTIYHNARCSKSRQGLAFLGENGIDPTIKEYLKEDLSEDELRSVLKALGIEAKDLIRKNEVDYKENFKGKEMSEDDWVKAMVKYPKLIERPIVIKDGKAVIGRPMEKIAELF